MLNIWGFNHSDFKLDSKKIHEHLFRDAKTMVVIDSKC